MRREQRHQTLLELTRNFGGYASISDLAELTGVSSLTIRRDAEELESAGLVRRGRGSIRLVERQGLTLEPSFLARTTVNAAAKEAIARAAAARVRASSTIAIDTGSTTLAFSRLLTLVEDLTIVTSSLVVATQTAQTHDVHVLAGRVRPAELSVVGPQACSSARDRHLDQVFLGAASLGEEVSDYSVDDAYTKRSFIQRADEVVLLCDASKFGKPAAALVCDLTAISTLITDSPPPPELAECLARADVEVVVTTHNKEKS